MDKSENEFACVVEPTDAAIATIRTAPGGNANAYAVVSENTVIATIEREGRPQPTESHWLRSALRRVLPPTKPWTLKLQQDVIQAEQSYSIIAATVLLIEHQIRSAASAG